MGSIRCGLRHETVRPSRVLFLLLFLLLNSLPGPSLGARLRVSPRAWIYGRNANSPELSAGTIPEGDGKDGNGPKTNVPEWDSPGKGEGPYGPDLSKAKAAEAPEAEKHAMELVERCALVAFSALFE